MLVSAGFLIAGCLLLIGGAEGLVRGAAALAMRLGMGPLVIGLTVVAFGTSAPELVASIEAARLGSTGMAIGNVMGSNIANIALVLGIAAVVRPLRVASQITRVDAPLALGVSVVTVLMMLNGVIGRFEGLLLSLGIIAYVYWSFWRVRGSVPVATINHSGDPEDKSETTPVSLYVSIPLTIISLGILIAGADLFVDGARLAAEIFGVPESVIGLTIMAVGTSLPEVATVIAASRKGLSDLVTGNAIGSNIFNTLCVLGFTALLFPLSRGAINTVDFAAFIGSAVLIWIAMATNHRLSRAEGLVLLAGYLAYVAYLYQHSLFA